MALPTFIIFGTRKAGTSSLYHYLHQHPEVYMNSLKGSRFFLYDPAAPEAGLNLPIKSVEEYEKLFEGAAKNNARAVGEAVPSYMNSSAAAARMKKLIPNVLLLASLRNPVDRIYSQYQMHMRNLKVSDRVPFTTENMEIWTKDGFYYKQLKSYFEIFNRDQIKIIIFEEWVKNPTSMLRKMYKYFGVDENFIPNMDIQYNVGGFEKNQYIASLLKHRKIFTKIKPMVPRGVRATVNQLRNRNMEKAPPLSTEMRKKLGELFLEDIQALEALIKIDLSVWKNANS